MGGVNVKNTIVEGLMQKVAPHPCSGCGKIGTTLCDNCKYNIISEPYSGCILCGKVAFEAVCAQHYVAFCKAWVVGQRVTVLKRVINAYKFENIKASAHSLVDLLDEVIPILPPTTQVLAIPTVRSHIRQRGYDHMEVIARLFAQKRNLQLIYPLKRVSSKTQHTLNRIDRQAESQLAFQVKQGLFLNAHAPILILDDVITTGSTVTSAANVLASAGVKNIFVAALAYQPLD